MQSTIARQPLHTLLAMPPTYDSQQATYMKPTTIMKPTTMVLTQ